MYKVINSVQHVYLVSVLVVRSVSNSAGQQPNDPDTELVSAFRASYLFKVAESGKTSK